MRRAVLLAGLMLAGCGAEGKEADAPADPLKVTLPAGTEAIILEEGETRIDVSDYIDRRVGPEAPNFPSVTNGTRCIILESKPYDPAINDPTVRVKVDDGPLQGAALVLPRRLLRPAPPKP